MWPRGEGDARATSEVARGVAAPHDSETEGARARGVVRGGKGGGEAGEAAVRLSGCAARGEVYRREAPRPEPRAERKHEEGVERSPHQKEAQGRRDVVGEGDDLAREKGGVDRGGVTQAPCGEGGREVDDQAHEVVDAVRHERVA